jgi:hypothetical protein
VTCRPLAARLAKTNPHHTVLLMIGGLGAILGMPLLPRMAFKEPADRKHGDAGHENDEHLA